MTSCSREIMRGMHSHAAVSMGVLLSAVALGCSSSNDSNNTGKCPIGTEACACTMGGACDPGLECRSNLCVRLSGTGGSSPGGSSGAGGSINGSGGGNGTGATQGSGGTGTVSNPASCPFPADSVTITETTDLNGQSKDSLSATFVLGTLVELDGTSCTRDPAAAALQGVWGTYPCNDAYSCGGCPVYVIGPNGANAVGNWLFLGSEAATYGTVAGCPTLSGIYSMCAPDCAGKACGDDGCGSVCGGCGSGLCCNTQQQCIVDGCAQCLDACNDACSGIPSCASSCCTGVGCQCDSVCPGPC